VRGDHQIARRQIFEGVVGDSPPYCFRSTAWSCALMPVMPVKMPPFRCASRSISQSLAALPASRQAAVPVGRVRQKVHRQLGAGEPTGGAQRGALRRQVFPGKADKHRMVSSIGTQRGY